MKRISIDPITRLEVSPDIALAPRVNITNCFRLFFRRHFTHFETNCITHGFLFVFNVLCLSFFDVHALFGLIHRTDNIGTRHMTPLWKNRVLVLTSNRGGGFQRKNERPGDFLTTWILSGGPPIINPQTA
jgi:hypothetical protein